MPTRHFFKVLPLVASFVLAGVAGCNKSAEQSAGSSGGQTAKGKMMQQRSFPAMGRIDRKDSRLDALLSPDAKIEQIAEGFDWSEGPVWSKKGDHLLFSDVPRNIVYKWDGGEISKFLTPSGYTGSIPRAGEPGSNGLTFDHDGRLVLAQHGDRRVARQEKDGKITVLADKYDGKRFNSPNDVVVKSNGDVYFTDPPYGLPKNVDDPTKEIPFQGVYRISKKDGKVTLLTKELTRPNGLCFSPDEKILYVAVSDPQRAQYWSFPVKEDGTLGEGKIFFDATPIAKSGKKGLPDGIKVDTKGNLWGTGPGGVLVFAPDGTHLGTIETDQATSNCGWGGDGSVLYITADMYICRVQTKAKGKVPGSK